MERKPLIYIAGPLTSSGYTEINVRNAILTAQQLYECGMIGFVSHLSIFWNMVVPSKNYKKWLDYDFQIILRCNALLRLPGKSYGADEEVKFAIENKIPVFHSITELVCTKEI